MNLAVQASGAPLGLQIAFCVVLLALGVGLVLIGSRGLRGTLPRNRFAGVRTEPALRSEDTFRLANRVAGLPNVVAGGVGGLAGLAVLGLPSTASVLVVGLVGLAGAFGLAVAGNVLGTRAAAALPQPKAAGCGGCCGGCTVKQSLCGS
ncbi:SdpI family protein [Streptoalloteichus hindustanus]|uniref:SdpI family protein n=1 Tax=Streptoalloteichus hindustanus TaxID=2017 RepID=UPI000A00263A|nr:SdpI family protein [Streptoalloteichus hindustanus]